MICFMFVFFFKQKTAYEMRISDWSSDVCSSDLRIEAGPVARGAADAAVHHEFGRILRHVRIEIVLDHPVHRFGEPALAAQRGAARGADLAGGEIGRASCRERVCQYV